MACTLFVLVVEKYLIPWKFVDFLASQKRREIRWVKVKGHCRLCWEHSKSQISWSWVENPCLEQEYRYPFWDWSRMQKIWKRCPVWTENTIARLIFARRNRYTVLFGCCRKWISYGIHRKRINKERNVWKKTSILRSFFCPCETNLSYRATSLFSWWHHP